MAAVCAAAVSVYAGKKREEEDSFLTAVARGNVAETQRLIASGADVNAAAEENTMDLAKMLIEAGADVNTSDDNGRTALMIAAEKNAVDLAKMLIEAGADVNASDDDGRTVFMYASYSIEELLHKAGVQ